MGESDQRTAIAVPLGGVTVAVSDLHVRYRTPTEAAHPGLRARLLGRSPQVQVRALASVSFVARSGEAIGVIGRNGSGKSTLLRVMAGLETPTRGTVLAESTPVLLGVNAALMPELSGVANVRLGLLAMGLRPAEVEELLPGVIELAGIGTSIHRPMRTYSTGMGSRLRFAIAAAANPRILLIDEALATGDAAFRERSEARMAELRQNAGTVFLVSHAAQTVEEMCTRAIWLDSGRVVMDGPAVETARKYRWWSWNIARGEVETAGRVLADVLAQQRVTPVTLLAPGREAVPPRHANPRG